MNKIIRVTVALILIIASVNVSQAQSIDNLDIKKGFYGFNINDGFDKWKTQLELFQENGTLKSYSYIGKDALNLFDYPVSRLLISFNKQQLVSITIDLGIWDAPEDGKYTDINKSLKKFSHLLAIFSSLYGKHSKYMPDVDNGKVTVYWEAKTHYLMPKLTYLGVTKGSRVSVGFGDAMQVSQSQVKTE